MDANRKFLTEGEKSPGGTHGDEVVVVVSSYDEALKAKKESTDAKSSFTDEASNLSDSGALARWESNAGSPKKGSEDPKVRLSTFISCSSAEVANKCSSYSNKPPKIPTETLSRRKSLARSSFSKPKSRFVEQPYLAALNSVEESVSLSQDRASRASYSPHRSSSNRSSPNGNTNKVITHREDIKSAPETPKTPLMASPGRGEEEEEEIYKAAEILVTEKSRRRLKTSVLIEWILLFCITGCLIASLTIHKLQNKVIWGLEMWKWCVLFMVTFCGGLVTRWLIHIIVFFIEKSFLLRKKVLYFVYGVKQSVQVCIWLGLVLLTWVLLINRGVERSAKANKIRHIVSGALLSFLVGAILWLIKTLSLKILASSFHVDKFFDRIQESIFHQYVLQTLSGPPLMEISERVGRTKSMGQLSFRKIKKEKGRDEQEVIDVGKLHNMNQEKVSAWTMRGLINVIRTTGLSTISNTLDESFDDEGGEKRDKEITNEWEAKAAAYQIFRNVARPGCKYIDEEDLLRFMNKEEVDSVLPLLPGAVETGKIKKSTLRNWVVKVYLDRKSLVHSLNDTKTAVKQLNRLASAVVIVLIIIVSLLLMGFATTKLFVFISSQMLVVAFMFGNTCKTVFEAIIFVFVTHPFDVGDRCVIDGVQMIVEEMNILTTVFLKYDNEKIFYPNSVLATKPISNYYRSPQMSDTVEFAVDVSTSIESIGDLKTRIKSYIEGKPQHWLPSHSVVVKEIENVNKMKMALYVNHTINFQNFGEKNNRRSELIIELKKIFEELSIKYHLLPQEINLSYVSSQQQNL